MILEGREKRVRRTGSLTGFVLSASLLARLRLLWNKASVALGARSRVAVVVMMGAGAMVVGGGVVTGSSNWPPGMVPLRGLGWFQSIVGRCSVVGESSESEPSPSEENDMRDSSIRSIAFVDGLVVEP
jgi:hypothetical protein